MFEVLKEILVDTGFLEIRDTNDCSSGGFCIKHDNRVYIYLEDSCLAVTETCKFYYYTFCFYKFGSIISIRYQKFRKENREDQIMLFLRAIIRGSFLNRQEEGLAKRLFIRKFYYGFE